MALSPAPMILVSACLICAIYKWLQPKPRYPPGPKGLPVIGSLLDINNERPWITYSEMAKQHGDIVMYWVMGKPVVLLGKMEHAHNLLQKRMVLYGDRPQLVVAQEFVTENGWFIGTARSEHNTHKKQRKIFNERLRAQALSEWAHPAELPRVHLLLQRLSKQPDRFASIIKCFTVNVMLSTTFAHGAVADLDDPLIARINRATDHQFTAQVQGRFWVDYAPFIKHLPGWLPGMGWKMKTLQWCDEVNALYRELWDVTKELNKDGEGEPCLVRSLLKTHMSEISEPEGHTIGAAIVDAGTDTLTGTTVVFIMVCMYFPYILEKVQAEVDEHIGNDRLPDFSDIKRIPFITALIRELFRWRTVAPLAIPHATIEDDEYAGYFIPKGATVFALSQYIHEDEELYLDHGTCRPERFLDEKGQLNELPHAGFGFGSRKCLGQHFAEQTLFLLITNLVWAFDITATVDAKGEKILPSLDPMDWGAFLASPPPMNFKAIITPRSPAAVETVNKAAKADLLL